jgi:Lar family restriction alleviation protein
MNMAEKNLMPCPFCGSEAKIGENYRGQYSVMCTDCGALVFFECCRDKERTISAWNTRDEKGGVTND